jgi:hypothetical protein
MAWLSYENTPYKRKHFVFLLPLILLVFSLAFFAACNDDPSGVLIDDPDNSGNTNVDPGTVGEFLLAFAENGDPSYGRIEIWGYNLTTDPDSGTVSFDAVLVNPTQFPIYPPIKFVITSLVPERVSVVNPSGFDNAGHPYFDFSDKLGSDGVLSPRERSQPCRFIFHTGTPRSFVIGYRFDFTWDTPGRMIVGAVFNDLNRNGQRERCEPGIPGVAVKLDSHTPEGGPIFMVTKTDENGAYRFTGLREGIYTVGSATPPGWTPTTPNQVIVTLTGWEENLLLVLFGFYNPHMPPTEWTLFGPIYVGPMSRVGTELDSTFYVPMDTLRDVMMPSLPVTYHLEVAYPPIMAPFPILYDSALVAINDVTVYHYINTGDPTFRDPIPGIFTLPDSLVQVGENHIYIRVNGDEHAALQFRVFATAGLREDC